MSIATTPRYDEKIVNVGDKPIQIRVQVMGSGPPLVYLHPAGGLIWDKTLQRLSETNTVYAPQHPGTSPADPYSIHKVDTYWDLLLLYEELVRNLGLSKPAVMGQSYGGMMAADLAACFPSLFSKIILLDPIGLWRDDVPIPLVQLAASGPEALLKYLFHDVTCEGALAMFGPLENEDATIKAMAAMVWSIGCTGKFFWPIADHGLSRRLHRISSESLIVWGRQDTLVPVIYAEEFSKRIRGSRVSIIDNCGHIPQVEKHLETLAAIKGFL